MSLSSIHPKFVRIIIMKLTIHDIIFSILKQLKIKFGPALIKIVGRTHLSREYTQVLSLQLYLLETVAENGGKGASSWNRDTGGEIRWRFDDLLEKRSRWKPQAAPIAAIRRRCGFGEWWFLLRTSASSRTYRIPRFSYTFPCRRGLHSPHSPWSRF